MHIYAKMHMHAYTLIVYVSVICMIIYTDLAVYTYMHIHKCIYIGIWCLQLHKDNKGLLYQHNLSLLEEQRKQLQDKIGGTEVTLENFDSVYQQLLETGI